MEYTTLGPTGLRVSRLCLGTWRFGDERAGEVEIQRDEALDLLDVAADLGINFLDTANVYGHPGRHSERYIGEWLADRDREELVIASKVYHPVGTRPNDQGLGRKHVRAQLEASLDALGTDYLDLYYLHRWDDETPIRETLATMDALVREGRVHHLGLSTAAAWTLVKALWAADVGGFEPVSVTQPPFDASGVNAERYEGFDLDPYLDVCADQHLAVCAYSPLAGGFLTGKYTREGAPEGARGERQPEWFHHRYISETAWAVLDAVRAVAAETAATPAQVALKWLIDEPRFTTVPVVGARTPEQLEENAGAVDVSLSTDQHDRIAAARTGETGDEP